MPRKSSYADVKLDVNPGASPSAEVMDPDTPFRILLMGDFSGRALKAPAPAARWKPVSIDRDNFEQVLGRMGVALPKLSLYFAEMDDFHPDRIYENSEIFRTLRERRKAGKPPAPPAETRASALDVRAARSGSLLDSILEESSPQPPRPVSRRDDLQSFVERV